MNVQPNQLPPDDASFSSSIENLTIEEKNSEVKKENENRYIDLQLPENQEIKKEIVNQNFRYASYLYMGAQNGNRSEGDEHGILLSTSDKISKLNGVKSLTKSKQSKFSEQFNCIKLIDNRLRSSEFGFKVDEKGNYYHLETGTIFNLIFDHQRDELIVAFVGLNYQEHLQTTAQEKNTVAIASAQTAFSDFTGNLPNGVRQCIELGKMIKEVIGIAQIQPVMIGHSHGGGLAQASALANNLKGIIINSRSIGAQTRALIGEEVIKENTKNITAFNVRGDWLTEAKTVKDLKPAFEAMLKTNFLALLLFEGFKEMSIPPNIGQGYYLPQPHGPDGLNAIEAHRRFYKAFQILR